MSFITFALLAGIAAANLAVGVINALKQNSDPWVVGMGFGVALFCSLLCIFGAIRK